MKRMRPVNSCFLCRKRRVRCDKQRPTCDRCVTARVKCQYDRAEPSEGADVGSSSGSRSTDISYVPDGDNSEKGHLSVSRGGRSSYKGSTFWANAIPSEDDQYICDTPSGTIPFNKWPATRNHDGRSRDHQDECLLPPRSGNFTLLEASSRQCRYCGSAYRLSCIQSLLPNRATCEKLCDIYFATVFPLIPILHVPEFANDFETFWREAENHRPHELGSPSVVRAKPTFLCLLPAILFAALSSASPSLIESILGETPSISAADMYSAGMICATLTGFPRSPTLYSLAAYIIVQSQFIREEEFSDSPDFIGTSFRIALGMGLHRNLPQAEFTTAERETRRRLWWYILHLDVMASASSGISPLFIDDKMANTNMIHEYDETVDDSGNKIQLTDVRYLVAIKRYQVTKEIRVILRSHFEDAFDSSNRLREAEMRLEAITDQINHTIKSLLDWSSSPENFLQGSSPKFDGFGRVWNLELESDNKEVKDFTSWSALLLHMMVHKAYCILYHPFFRNAISITELPVRESAIKNAQGFLQLFIRVCDDPISQPFHWMYPGTYQPFQALALLLADLLHHPHSEEASISRGIVDAIFELYRVDEGIVSQMDPPRRQLSGVGRTAWSMLVRTRKKALDIIGEDHHVLLPSQLISADNCICGARIAANHNPTREDQPQTRDNSSTPHPCDDDPWVMSETLYSNDFNWQEFDASIASQAGFIS